MAIKNRYRIAAVSRLTGLPADTIRAWERRYRLVEPARDDAGIRLYSEEDVARLQFAASVVGLGHPIGLVATMTDAELAGILADRRDGDVADSRSAISCTLADMLKAIHNFDVVRAESLLNAAALFLSPAELVVGVLAPLMRAIGDGWESGRLSIAQEHLTSQLVRNIIANLTRLSTVTKKETILLATPPGEAHEFGVLFAACLASLAGIKPLILGSSVPVPELVRTARRATPSVVVISALRDAQDIDMAAYCGRLAAKLPPACAIWVGGHRAHRRAIAAHENKRLQFIPSLEHFEKQVALLN